MVLENSIFDMAYWRGTISLRSALKIPIFDFIRLSQNWIWPSPVSCSEAWTNQIIAGLELRSFICLLIDCYCDKVCFLQIWFGYVWIECGLHLAVVVDYRLSNHNMSNVALFFHGHETTAASLTQSAVPKLREKCIKMRQKIKILRIHSFGLLAKIPWCNNPWNRCGQALETTNRRPRGRLSIMLWKFSRSWPNRFVWNFKTS